jgi:hypothetical protein
MVGTGHSTPLGSPGFSQACSVIKIGRHLSLPVAKIEQANGKPDQINARYEFVELVVRSPQRARKYPEIEEGFRSGRPMAWLERIVLGAWGEILLEQDGGTLTCHGYSSGLGSLAKTRVDEQCRGGLGGGADGSR